MGWISDRHMREGGSIGTGPKGGKHKGPLRKVEAVLRRAVSIFDTDWVLLECGHEGESYGGARARCKTCGEAGDLSWAEWHRRAREKASSEFGIRRVPRDMFREQWLQGNSVQEGVEQVRLRLEGLCP